MATNDMGPGPLKKARRLVKKITQKVTKGTFLEDSKKYPGEKNNPFTRKGGATKMKMGGIKKPLKKAQDGKSVYSGPMNEHESNVIDDSNMSAAAKAKARQPFLNPKNTRNQAVLEAGDVMTDERAKYYDQGAIWANQVPKPGPHVSPYHKKGGAAKKMYKTGGMVNANANLKATATAGSRGVKAGVNPKAAASNVAKKPSKPRSKAPKKATPGRK